MFCGKCGTQIPDNAAFCPSCGNVMGAQAAETTQVVTEAPKKKATGKLIGIIAAVAVVVAVAIILICVFAGGGSSGSPEAVVEKYLDGYLNNDPDAMFECFHEDVLEVIAEGDYEGDVDVIKENFEEMCDSMEEQREEYDIKMSYEILDTVDLKDDELEDMKEEFLEEADIKITAAAEVTVNLITKGEYEGQEIDESDETDVVVVEIDGKWYLHPDFMM